MSNPIDLGKLQASQHAAESSFHKANANRLSMHSKMLAAQRAYDAAAQKCSAAQNVLDKAKQAVIDGARSVAQG